MVKLIFVYLEMEDNNYMKDEMFQDIIDCLQDVLPEKWEKVVFYSNYFQDSYSMKYYVKEIDEKYIDCFSLNNISKQELLNLFTSIDNVILPVRSQLKGKDKWSVMTLQVNRDGRFHVDYDYTDFPDGVISYEREWKQKHLV